MGFVSFCFTWTAFSAVESTTGAEELLIFVISLLWLSRVTILDVHMKIPLFSFPCVGSLLIHLFVIFWREF